MDPNTLNHLIWTKPVLGGGLLSAARAARLMELRTACAKIATIGEYYKLRARSTRATYGGIICSFLGTIAIVAALTSLIY